MKTIKILTILALIGWTFAAYPQCETITVSHFTVNGVAPLDKVVTYQTVTGVPGEPYKCWITSNLGADRQAVSAGDASIESAGWYFQFNHRQGYITGGPNWINYINDNSNWTAANDPCAELGVNWRLPTITEWKNIRARYIYNINYGFNGKLKLHGAGWLDPYSGTLTMTGKYGIYWSSNQTTYTNWGQGFAVFASGAATSMYQKAQGMSIRCVK